MWSVGNWRDGIGQRKNRPVRTNFRDDRPEPNSFGTEEWNETPRRAQKTETIIEYQWEILGRSDPKRSIRLVVDEYGAWYRPGTEPDPSHFPGQQSTLRDAPLTY